MLSVLLLALSSCGKPEDSNDRLLLAVSQDVPNLDVQKSTGRVLRDMLVGQVYERLFVPGADGEVLPELAESWSISDDGHELVVKLREGVLFHDGTLFDGHDAEASIRRWADAYGAARTMLGNYWIESDTGSLTIRSDGNLSLLPYLMASAPQAPVMMPLEKMEENRFGLVSDVVGTGPYKLSSFETGVGLTLTKNEKYESYSEEADGLWGRKDAEWESIEYRIVPESMNRRLGLEKGEYDYINEVMSEDMPSLSRNQDVTLVGAEETGSIALVFNKRTDLGSDREFRRAVSLALDKDAVMKACYGDYGYRIHSDYMEDHQKAFGVEGDPYAAYDPEKAGEYLAGSSYDGRPFRILTSNLSNMEKIALSAEHYLEAIGIDTEVRVLDWAGFLSERKDDESYDMFVSAFSTVALPQMKLFLGADYPGWYEDENAALIMDALNDASSIDEAAEVWQEGQKYFWSEVPVIVPGHYMTVNAVRSDIEGVISQDGTHFWRSRRTDGSR